MNEKEFSKNYDVLKLTHDDIDKIYDLCKMNSTFYRYYPPFVTKDSIEEDMIILPNNVKKENKYYVGYYKNNELIAVLDLIDGYPNPETVFIGFFMLDVKFQKRGIGMTIISELVEYVRSLGYKYIRLAWAKGNPEAEHFWLKNNFVPIKETSNSTGNSLILAQKEILSK